MSALLVALALTATPRAERCHLTLEAAEHAAPGELRSILRSLPPPSITPDQRGALPSLDAAIDAFDEPAPTPEQRTAALQTLRAICTQLDRPPPDAVAADRAALTGILEQPQFARRKGQEWALERLVARFIDLIKELIQERGFRSYSLIGRDIFLGLVVVVAVYFGFQVLRRRRDEELAAEPAGAAPSISREPTLDELLTSARQALARGDAREALRGEMRALLLALVERGLADRRGAATNREVAQSLVSRGVDPELARQTLDLARRFDVAIYGTHAPDLAEAARFGHDAEALRSRVLERAP